MFVIILTLTNLNHFSVNDNIFVMINNTNRSANLIRKPLPHVIIYCRYIIGLSAFLEYISIKLWYKIHIIHTLYTHICDNI